MRKDYIDILDLWDAYYFTRCDIYGDALLDVSLRDFLKKYYTIDITWKLGFTGPEVCKQVNVVVIDGEKSYNINDIIEEMSN